jgi:hypothetical protein
MIGVPLFRVFLACSGLAFSEDVRIAYEAEARYNRLVRR